MTLLALYVGCLALGGILIAVSVLGGGHDDASDGDHGDAGAGDHDAGMDHDHDHGHGHDAHHDTGAGAAVAATLLSLRFWTFALAAFGLSGLLLHLAGISAGVGAAVSAVTGLVVGAAVSALLRSFSKDTVSSSVSTRDLAGRDAEVVLPVGPGKLGKIRLIHQGQIIELPATTRESRRIERLERVLVVEVKDGTADVTPAGPDRRTDVSVPVTS